VALTGGLIGPPDAPLSEPRAVDGLPAFFGASDIDPFVPLERVEVTAAAFHAAGAVVSTVAYPGAFHEIVADEVEQCGRILDLAENQLLPR
jgi:predicted esterase